MLGLKYLLMILGLGLFGSTGALAAYDVYISEQLRRVLRRNRTIPSIPSLAQNTMMRHQHSRGLRWRVQMGPLSVARKSLPPRVGEHRVVLSSGRA